MRDEYSLDVDDVAASVRGSGLAVVAEIQGKRLVAIDDVNQIRVIVVDAQDLPRDRKVIILEIPVWGMVVSVADRCVGFRIRPWNGG